MSNSQRIFRAVVIAFAACGTAHAAPPGRLPQDGRLLDANPSLQGAQNYARPVSPLMAGNAIANGVAGRGFSLRAPGVIGDPTAFHGYLGSASLGGFRRDSVSSSEAQFGSVGALTPRPYYDRSGTVPTAGFLQSPLSADFPGRVDRQNLPPLSAPIQFGSGGPIDMRVNTQTSAFERAPAQLPPIQTPTNSSIFGVRNSGLPRQLTPEDLEPRDLIPGSKTPVPRLRLRENEQNENEPGVTPAPAPTFGAPLTPVFGQRRPEDSRTPQPAAGPRNPPDTTLGAARPLDNRLERNPPPPQMPVAGNPAGGRPTAPPAFTDPSMLPGYDTYNDMRMALSLAREPNAPWYEQMQETVRHNPALEESLHGRAELPVREFVDRYLQKSLKSFTGAGPSQINNELLKAESLLEIGNYYEAAERYRIAHLLDPANPLPLIGEGHALLGAGDYLRAAISISAGLKAFPDIGKFSFDLRSMFKSAEVIDIRRAELMKRLDQVEDVRLRFLLGYLEYHTGMRESAMENLERAAREDSSNSIISHYPDLLRARSESPQSMQPAPAGAQPSEPGAVQPPPEREPRRYPDSKLVIPPEEKPGGE